MANVEIVDEIDEIGEIINEGKTKIIYNVISDDTLCCIRSKDRITAGDGAKSHSLEGKGEISTFTNARVFQLLNEAGIKTAFIEVISGKDFIAKKCVMIPIEWVTRRLATGSFLKRHPGVPEGYRFNPPLQETFFKDDANHDPQWSDEQIISANFQFGGVKITQDEVTIMKRTSLAVFEILERVWAVRDIALIDMKIEFGVDSNGEILVADVIDSDSWRLWPSGDKKLMKDKQVYRDLLTVTKENLETIKRNFKWLYEQLNDICLSSNSLVVILMGSPSDEVHCKEIENHARAMGLQSQLRICSAHKGTEETLNILAEYEACREKVVLIAVAGRSNGLGPVLSGNSVLPVINCPPLKSDNIERSVWSSLDVPSGLGCTTVVHPEGAALAAAQIHAIHDHVVWARLRARQLTNLVNLIRADAKLRNQ